MAKQKKLSSMFTSVSKEQNQISVEQELVKMKKKMEEEEEKEDNIEEKRPIGRLLNSVRGDVAHLR